MRAASGEGAGRRGVLFQPECGSNGGTRSGIIRSGLRAGARDERRPASSGSGAHLSSGAQTSAEAIALTGGTEAVRTAQRVDRAGVRNPKRASRNAELLSSRAGGCERGVLIDGSGLQLDARTPYAATLSNRNWARSSAKRFNRAKLSITVGTNRVATQTLKPYPDTNHLCGHLGA